MIPAEYSYIDHIPNGWTMSKRNALTAGVRDRIRQLISNSGKILYKEDLIKERDILVLSIKQGDFSVSMVHEHDKRYVDLVFNYTFRDKQIELMQNVFKDKSVLLRTQLMIKQIIVDNSQSHEVTFSGTNDKVISKILIKKRIYPLDDFSLNDFEHCVQDLINTAIKLEDVLVVFEPSASSDYELKTKPSDEDLSRMFI
jgi:hypothetical protein